MSFALWLECHGQLEVMSRFNHMLVVSDGEGLSRTHKLDLRRGK